MILTKNNWIQNGPMWMTRSSARTVLWDEARQKKRDCNNYDSWDVSNEDDGVRMLDHWTDTTRLACKYKDNNNCIISNE